MLAQTKSQYFTYVHIYADGEIFLLPNGEKCGSIADLSELSEEIKETERREGLLLYSSEEPLAGSLERFLAATEVILGASLDVKLVDPHPEVYGYHNSYLPYLEEAVEAAEADVRGLKRYLAFTKEVLDSSPPNSPNYQRHLQFLSRLKDRLRRAKEALQKLTDLNFDLSADGEQVQ